MTAVFGVAVVLGFLGTGTAARVLRSMGVWDVSNARSSHRGSVTRGGGIGLLAGALVATAWALSDQSLSLALIVAVGVVVAFAGVGLADDLRGVSVRVRLLLQLLLGWVGVSAVLAPSAISGVLAMGATLVGTLWVAAFVNVFNFMDGVNGISALVTVAAGLVYAAAGSVEGDPTLMVCALAVAGAALGALPWNAPRARVFLGDVGSYGLGAALGLLALATLVLGSGPLVALAPLALYCADTGFALVRKMVRGDPLWAPHRDHVYQQLVHNHGFPHLASSALVASASSLLGLAAVLLPWEAALPVILVTVVGYVMLPAVLPKQV